MLKSVTWTSASLGLLLLAIAAPTRAQSPQVLPPLGPEHTLSLPALDVGKSLGESIDSKLIGVPMQIGVVADARGTGVDQGRWTELDDGSWLWQLEVMGPNANALDFSFSEFRLPHGAELIIRGSTKGQQLGPFTDRDNRPHGEFYTPMLAGSRATLELRVSAERRADVRLQLGGVSRAFRDPFGTEPAIAGLLKSGSCNIDTICPQGDPWRSQIASVAHYTFRDNGGSTFVCTGQLTADASRANDRLVTTANHCIGSDSEARTMVLYWGYESPVCRTPGSGASGSRLPLSGNFRASQSGARLLGTHVDSDFTLVELETSVPASAQAVATGWDRREAVPPRTFTVHHPSGHEKRISFDDQAPVLLNSPVEGLTGRLYWEILDWDAGTTEGGSSGSGLWNADGRLIGALSGGTAACGNDLPDYYGRLSTAWEGGGSSATRVRDGLDPFGTGAQFVDGGGASLSGVSISSPAFVSGVDAGIAARFEASVSGGRPPYRYEWDLDGDGEVDRSGSAASILASFPSMRNVQVSVRVIDADGLSGDEGRNLTVRGPRIAATAQGGATQVCGNNNSQIDPGERWQQTIRLRNEGTATQPSGNALFAASSAGVEFGPGSGGYTATTSALGGCSVSWIDLVGGAFSTPALVTSVADGNSFGPLDDARTPLITLGGTGFSFYGQSVSQAVMSTNGYLSFDSQETGGDFSPACTADYSQGAVGPQLRPYFDDLVIPGSGASPASGAGLRYRYFSSCPRSAEVGGPQGCHVFSWTRMQRYNLAVAVGDFDFQAIAYESSGQISYQYRTASDDAGAEATIGIANASGSETFNLSCQAGSPAPANSAVCLFDPSAQPSTSSIVRLPAAAPVLNPIAEGASVDIALPFSVDASAPCGSPIGFDYVATASPEAHSFQSSSVFGGRVAEACQPVSGCPVQGTPPTVDPGAYFNFQRDGNGVVNFVYPLGDGRATFGGAWFTALTNRTPIWYTLQGAIADGAGRVPITLFQNVATPGLGGFAVVDQKVGDAWVAQLESQKMMLAWRFDDGRSGAEILQLAGFPRGTPNHTQTWFSDDEPGWGLVIQSLRPASPLEFFGAFVYDNEGAPRWAVGDIGSATGGTVPLNAVRPHCPACPHIVDWAAETVGAGSLQIDYSATNRATLSTSIVLPAPFSGLWDRTSVPIIPIAEPEQ